jgi:hypothetical protein
MAFHLLPASHAKPAHAPQLNRRLVVAASAASFAVVAGGAWLFAHPGLNPLSDPQAALARTLLSANAATLVLTVLGAVGLLAGMAALARPDSKHIRRALVIVALLEVVGAALLQGVTTIALAGYLVAMALPFGLAWLSVQVIRRYRQLRWPAGVALAAIGVWGFSTGAFWPTHLAGLAAGLAAGFAGQALQLGLSALVTGVAACWCLVLLAALKPTSAATRWGDWVLRHRRGVTWLAAACPLPYGLARASWLTPWPLLSPAGEVLDPEIRLWGLLLGGGAVLGSVLTVGLIRPWGLVFPRWMPRWAGRPVPVGAATVPGGVVAGILCVSAMPMIWFALAPGPTSVFSAASVLTRLAATLIFPFWLWGPALALAVWGYALHRRALAS